METTTEAMTADSVRVLLEAAGAEVMARSGRSENYSAPREFSFEVKGIFPNGMAVHIVARQFNYRDPWEAKGRVNDLVDMMLYRNNALTPLPKGYQFFQDIDEECGLDADALKSAIDCIAGVSLKLYDLQEMTGDL